MQKDVISKLLDEVASGKVSVKDARKALEEVELDEETYFRAIDHGVFNPAEAGTIVNASLAPSGGSALAILFFVWGIFWTLFWIGNMLYGLFNGWDQQILSFDFAMAVSTVLMMGIVYMKWLLPDLVII